MAKFLLFDVYGPMASWGQVAVGEVRPSGRLPTRSALLGLFAASLGLGRDDEKAHSDLAGSIRLAVLVEAEGVHLEDYHTVQIRPPRRGYLALTRGDQLRGRRDERDSIISQRHYRCDALYSVATWQESGSAPRWSLEELSGALAQPHFVLYLGRKACPPALPFRPRLVEAANLVDAFAMDPTPVDEMLGTLPRDPAATLIWEQDRMIAGLAPERTELPRDEPVSRKRWSFAVREQFVAYLPREV